MLQPKVMCDLVINWIVQQLGKDNSNLQELCEYVCKLNFSLKYKRIFILDAFTLS